MMLWANRVLPASSCNEHRRATCARMEFAGADKSPSRLASTTSRQRCTQRQLCRHCAASARKRSCRSSLFAASNLLHERFEARIAAKIVEEWISREEEQVAFIAFRKAVIERFDGAFFFACGGVGVGQGVIRTLC